MTTVYVLTRVPGPEDLSLLEPGNESVFFLAGQALLTPPGSLDGKQVWVMDEEVRELGLDCKLPKGFTSKPAQEIVETLANARVYNL